MASASQFRREVVNYLLPPSLGNPILVIPLRPAIRAFANFRQIMELARYYSIRTHSFTDFSEGTPLHDQAVPLRGSRVKLVAHGAGEANNFFAGERSAIIEAFPYGMKNSIFERHALRLGKPTAKIKLCVNRDQECIIVLFDRGSNLPSLKQIVYIQHSSISFAKTPPDSSTTSSQSALMPSNAAPFGFRYASWRKPSLNPSKFKGLTSAAGFPLDTARFSLKSPTAGS
jgi:hypothetical protein